MKGTDGGLGVGGREAGVLARDPRFPAFSRLWHQACYTFLHFPGGLVGEGDAEDVAGCNAVPDQVGDAEGDDPRFARAGTRQNEQRSPQGLDGLALLRVERGQIQHRARSLVCDEINASAQETFLRKARSGWYKLKN